MADNELLNNPDKLPHRTGNDSWSETGLSLGYDTNHSINGTSSSNTCNDEHEPNNTLSDALFLPKFGKQLDANENISACLEKSKSDEDWYLIGINAGGTLTVTIGNIDSNTGIEIYNTAGVKINANISTTSDSKTIQYSTNGLQCLPLYIQVFSNDGTGSDDYNLNIDWEHDSSSSNTSGSILEYISNSMSLSLDHINMVTGNTVNTGLTISGVSSIYENEILSLSASGGGGNFSWYVNNEFHGTGSTISINNLSVGILKILVVDNDDVCLSGVKEVEVITNPTSPEIPPNDDCLGAVTLYPKINCNYTLGTVNNATGDNFSDDPPSCDSYTGNMAGEGVFYEFIATGTTHNIIVNPEDGTLDAVVVVYSGSDCYNLKEFTCDDPPGNVTVNLSRNNFEIGGKYWIRVYDYGKVPPTNGNFRICVTGEEITSGEGASCTDAINLTLNQTYSGTTIGGADNWDKYHGATTYNGNVWNNAGYERIHKITTSQTGDLKTEISNLNGVDLDVYILTDCDANSAKGFVASEYSIYENAPSGTYYIVVDGYNTHNGSYSLKVTLDNVITPNNPGLELYEINIDDDSTTGDSNGDGDEKAEPGEMIELDVRLNNTGNTDLNHVKGILSTNDANIEITDDEQSWGTISADSKEWTKDFDFIVSSNCPEKDITFTLNITSDEGSWEETFTIHIYSNNASGGDDDIYITKESVSPTTIEAGKDFNVICWPKYSGNTVRDDLENVKIGYFLSKDKIWDLSDERIGKDICNIGSDYITDDEDASLTIPENTTPGTYYILFVADYTEDINETDESNNVEFVKITVLAKETSMDMTYIPDDNFEQALIDLGYDDVLDDFIIINNISSITFLDVAGKGIADATGIEDFVSLETLYFQINNLMEIDISQNINLSFFSCAENQISSMDVTNNPKLQSLSVSDNQLTSIDISQNLSLDFLSCGYNQLTELNLNNNNALEMINCHNNQLINLDISNNPNLIYVWCKNNQIETIDVSQNPNLEELNFSNNSLLTLNLKNGNNQILTDLMATNNPDLFCIQVDDEDMANAGNGVYENWHKDPTAIYSEDCSTFLGKSDLIVYSGEINNSIIHVNDTVKISCIVKNIGNEKSTPTILRYFLSEHNDGYYGIVFQQVEIPELEANETFESTILEVANITYSYDFKYFHIVADDDHACNEENENNNGVTIPITYLPACTYSLSKTEQTFSHVGGNGSVTINTQRGCPWLIYENCQWLTIDSIVYEVITNLGGSGGEAGTSANNVEPEYTGKGSALIYFSVAPNDGLYNRDCQLMVANEIFIITVEAFSLPSDNFEIISTDATCPNKNNGKVHIKAKNSDHSYTATISGDNFNKQASFKDSILIEDIPVGYYTLYIDVEDENYEQPFGFSINEPEPFSVSTGIVGYVDGSIETIFNGGAPPYTISLNNNIIMSTDAPSAIFQGRSGDVLKITSNNVCANVHEEVLDFLPDFTQLLTPNFDGMNEKLVHQKIQIFDEDLEVYIINRFGKILFHSKLIDIESFNGDQLPDGTYWYILNRDNEFIKGGFFQIEKLK